MKVLVSDLTYIDYFDTEALNDDLLGGADLETGLMDVVNYIPNAIYEGIENITTKVHLQFDSVIEWLEDGVEVKMLTSMKSPESVADNVKFNFNKDLKIPTIVSIDKDLTGVSKLVTDNIPVMYKELDKLIVTVDKEVSRYISMENYTIGATVPTEVKKAKTSLEKIREELKSKTTAEEVDTITILDAFGNFKGSVEFYKNLDKVVSLVKPKQVYKFKDRLDVLNKRLNVLHEKVSADESVSKQSMKVLAEMLTVLANYSSAFSVNYGLYVDLCEIEHTYVDALKNADTK